MRGAFVPSTRITSSVVAAVSVSASCMSPMRLMFCINMTLTIMFDDEEFKKFPTSAHARLLGGTKRNAAPPRCKKQEVHSLRCLYLNPWKSPPLGVCGFMRLIDQILRYYVVKFVRFELWRTRVYYGCCCCSRCSRGYLVANKSSAIILLATLAGRGRRLRCHTETTIINRCLALSR